MLLDAHGDVRHIARRATPLQRSSEGSHLDPDALIAVALETMRECTSGADDVVGVGVASMAESGVPLDAAGRPLAEIIAWADRRSAGDAAAIAEAAGERDLFAVTGLRAEAKYTLPKLRWLRRERSGPMRRLHAWAGVADLLALQLTGELGTDASLACRTLAFDLGAGRWDARLLGLAGVLPEQMPRLVAAGTAVGRVTAEGQALSGLPRGTPVAVAGHDHLVGAFGAGVHRPRRIADSMGTAEVAVLPLDAPILGDAARQAGLTAGIAAGSARPYLLGNLPASGAMLEWLRSALLGGAELPPPSRVPSGILARPYVGGAGAPRPKPLAAASLAGLRADHGPGDIGLAFVEGAAFQLRWIGETLARVSGTTIVEVTLFGGGSRDRTWAATKANVNPWPTQLAASSEATAIGAAMIGAMAAGQPPPAPKPATALARDDALAAAYEELYRDRFLPPASASWWPDDEQPRV